LGPGSREIAGAMGVLEPIHPPTEDWEDSGIPLLCYATGDLGLRPEFFPTLNHWLSQLLTCLVNGLLWLNLVYPGQ
jgi:hypothetical protein